ncbi:hypothetical protein [Pseudooceanicola sp.]|uniref:hypothetical protein n=1 Tax=Pseudooceanicola sp. TaxID=1914328 RepID=UPI0026348637|nr:hypothetical protein [Pseudooceanicola sp.]MDF1855065.1 hypothetical protein [Pseudooceanicola sp.]
MRNITVLTAGFLTTLVTPALAGAPVPLPIAGVTGPVGLAVAAVGYVGYRILRRNK